MFLLYKARVCKSWLLSASCILKQCFLGTQAQHPFMYHLWLLYGRVEDILMDSYYSRFYKNISQSWLYKLKHYTFLVKNYKKSEMLSPTFYIFTPKLKQIFIALRSSKHVPRAFDSCDKVLSNTKSLILLIKRSQKQPIFSWAMRLKNWETIP